MNRLNKLIAAVLIWSTAGFGQQISGGSVSGAGWIAPNSGVTVLSVGCGASANGVNNLDQSTCGNTTANPYEDLPGGVQPTNTDTISACGATLTTANHVYRVTADLSCGATTRAITINGVAGMTLDLNGHSITGYIQNDIAQAMPSGFTLVNGTVTCAIVNPTPGCIDFPVNSSTTSATILFSHLTLINTTDPLTNNKVLLKVDATGSTYTGTGPQFKATHITAALGNAPTSGRVWIMNFVTPLAVEVSNSKLTCNSDAATCQGIDFNGAVGSTAHNNQLVMTNMNLGANPAADTPRAMICEGTANNCAVYNNTITANGNRAFRIRSLGPAGGGNKAPQNVLVHDNYIANITDEGYSYSTANTGAFHIGDPDGTGSGGLGEDDVSGLTIYANTFDIEGGKAFWARDVNNFTIRDNTVTCVTCNAGKFADFETLLGCGGSPSCGTGTAGTINVLRNGSSLGGLTGGGGFQYQVDLGSTITLICKSGSTVTAGSNGTGTFTINNSSC